MVNNKYGISNPWFIRSNRKDPLLIKFINTFIKQIFYKQNIFISSVYIQEFPQFYQITFNIYPLEQGTYQNIYILINVLKSILVLITKKNINIQFRIANDLLNNIDLLEDWIHNKIYLQPLSIKKLIKSLKTFYASTINQNKYSR